VHDPCPAVHNLNELKDLDWTISALDDENRKQGVEITKRTIDLALKLGANSVIVHPGQVTGDRSMDKQLRTLYEKGAQGTPEYEDLKRKLIADRKSRSSAHLEAVIKSVREIVEYAQKMKMSIGLENRYRYYDIPLPDEMEHLLDVCHEPWFGFQYDVGHAQTLDRLGLCRHEEWLQRFGDRIIGVHLHDVKGLQDHQAPGLGEVDFSMVARFLPEYAFRTLEVGDWNTQSEIVQGMEVLVAKGCIKRI
jgi:sugar phosphate isomerase/epimerase